MVAAENSLQLLNKVLQYVDAQEKKSALIKEYEHKNNEASSLQKQYNMQMSDSEVITEFKRVAKLMTGKLVAAYQLQFDAEQKNFQEVLREAKTLVKEAKDFISEYGTKLPKLEAKYAQLDKEYKFCCSKLTPAEIDIVRDSRKLLKILLMMMFPDISTGLRIMFQKFLKSTSISRSLGMICPNPDF